MKKAITITLSLLLCLALAACGGKPQNTTQPDQQAELPPVETVPSPEPEAPAEPEFRTVTDPMGRTHEIPADLERVVVLSAGECEIVYALGAGDLVVGRGEYCNYPEQVADITAIQSGSETNLEQILALEPQMVISTTMDQTLEQVDALEKAGIPVFVTTETGIEGVYEAIRGIGQALGRDTEADALVGDMQTRFDTIRNACADKEAKTVYFEVSPLQYGLWTAGTDTFMDEIAQMLGLTNIFSDISGWAAVSEEQVIERNPDYIVTNAMYFGEGALPADEILSRPGWEGIAAIQNGNVYNANSDQISRPGPRLADAAELLYDFVYGE